LIIGRIIKSLPQDIRF